MAIRDIGEERASDTEEEDSRTLNWMIAKSLLDANAHETRAFEHHLLRTYYPDGSSELEATKEHIGAAIDEHEKIIEQLELAQRAVDEMRNEECVE